MDRERRDAVPVFVAGVAHLLSRVVNIRRGIEAGHQAVEGGSHVRGREGCLMLVVTAVDVRLRHDGFNLGHRHDGQEADEEEE